MEYQKQSSAQTGRSPILMNTTNPASMKTRLAIFASLSLVALVLGIVAIPIAQAQTFNVLYNFNGDSGATPYGQPVLANGNIYGTARNSSVAGVEGTVWELSSGGTFSVLHSFDGSDGANPEAGVKLENGKIFGTTALGGSVGSGTVFEIASGGTFSTLYNFGSQPNDPKDIEMGVNLEDGEFLGTSSQGGRFGQGAVWKLSGGQETVLHSFDGDDGSAPVFGSLTKFKNGNLYGLASGGGTGGGGTLWKIEPSGTFRVLHNLSGSDGCGPIGSLRYYSDNLYGTAVGCGSGSGTVWQYNLSTAAFTVLHSFSGADGASPFGGVGCQQETVSGDIVCAGNLFGTTFLGGTSDLGTVWEIDTNGTFSTLYNFAGPDGANPSDRPFVDAQGNLYGTTETGGSFEEGTLWEITPSPDFVYPMNPFYLQVPSPSTAPHCGTLPSGRDLICYSPQMIRAAYNFVNPLWEGIGLNGSGQTIAIIEAYGSPRIVGTALPSYSSSDLAIFDRTFGLPDPPSLVVVDGSCTPILSTQVVEAGWTMETTLDVEYAHATAPGANIVLVVTPDSSADSFNNALPCAIGAPGVTVVSQSFGYPEYLTTAALEELYDATILQPALAANPNVAVLAAAGDLGATDGGLSSTSAFFPATDPSVIAVGGTEGFRYPEGLLSPSDGYGNEQVWNEADTKDKIIGATGGAPSVAFPTPPFQGGVNPLSFRTIPDVSFNAALNGGVLVYSSALGGSKVGWYVMGGTGAAVSQWAGIVAMVDQELVLRGSEPLGSNLFLDSLYGLTTSATDFHDITVGNNRRAHTPFGFPAEPGFDDATGWGTPNVTNFVTDLANTRIRPSIQSFNPTSGPVGQAVIIAGSGFTGATEVTFSGVNAAFTVNSDTQVTATVPTGAVSGLIGITTPGGTAASATNFTVEP